MGYRVPPGISDATVPNPVFNLSPAATVDEGNNWINITWGPLSLVNTSNGSLNGTTLGDYAPSSTSSVINYIPASAPTYSAAPGLDFFDIQRKANSFVDAGAVEFAGTPAAPRATVSPSTSTAINFGLQAIGTTTPPASQRAVTISNTGAAALTINTITFSGQFVRGAALGTDCGAAVVTIAPGASCTISIAFSPTSSGFQGGMLNITTNDPPRASFTWQLSGTGATTVAVSVPVPALTTAIADRTVKHGVATVTNTGGGPTTVQSFTVAKTAGPAAGMFATEAPASGTPCVAGTTTLAPGASCTIGVKYTPPTSGTIGTSTAHMLVFDTGALTPSQVSANFNGN
jgi:hypothetical protein